MPRNPRATRHPHSFARSALLIAAVALTLSGHGVEAAPVAAGDDERPDLNIIESRTVSLVDECADATVRLEFRGRMASSGSGVIIDSNGLVLTAGHVGSRPGRRVEVLLPDGRSFRGETLGQIFNDDVDLGLIRLEPLPEGEPFPSVSLAAEDSIERGEWVVTLGYAAGISASMDTQPAARLGRVIGVDGGELAVDSPFDAGDSGGPVFDLEGRLVGIVSRCGHEAWQNIATGVDAIHAFLPHLEADTLDDIDAEAWSGNGARRGARRTKRDPRLLDDIAATTGSTPGFTAELRYEDRLVGMGTIVGPDRIVAKASLLARQSKEAIAVYENPVDGRRMAIPVTPLAIDPELDLVLLDAPGVTGPDRRPELRSAPVEAGTMLVVLDDDGDPTDFGIVARDRDVLRVEDASEDRPFIGIAYSVERDGSGVRITRVVPSSSAAGAGLRVGDVLGSLDGRPLRSRRTLAGELNERAIGDQVRFEVDRDGDAREIEMELGIRPGASTYGLPTNTTTGTSRLRGGFGEVHLLDADIPPHQIGSPVVDLEGRLVGWTVARRTRTSVVVVPWTRLMDRIDRLEPDRDEAARRLCAYRVGVTESSDGTIELSASDAFPIGDAIRRERFAPDGGTTWGSWSDVDDGLEWSIRVDRPGRFRVMIDQACPRRDAGTPIRFSVGDSAVDARTEATDGWTQFGSFSLGEIEITETGDVVARLLPLASPRNAVMKFAGITLLRLEDLEPAEDEAMLMTPLRESRP
ncbi:MAG: trypsin-like peptidase domain-containing protein [Phycisphaerales bacterium]|nr:trypsin-like peptidase domain-containing protein [Phycisphaerales bacterium]